MYYMVVAYERGQPVCEAASIGRGLPAREASAVAHDLREEHPDAIVAIIPSPPSRNFVYIDGRRR